jgi:acyl carrier protein
MTKNEIFTILSDYLVEYFEVPRSQITLEAKLYEDLDLDSIDAVDLVVKLQELTKKKIPPTDFKEVRSVGDVVEKVHALLQE